MLDTSNITTAIAFMIRTGTPERELIATVARHYPDLDRKAFLAALQDATAAAERQALRSH